MYQIGINPTEVVLAVDVAEGKAPHRLGTIAWHVDADGTKAYKWVQYSEEAAAVDGVTGEACYYVADSGYGAHEVTSDLSASDEVGAGIIQATLSEGDQGWVQIKGPATMSIALTAGADGDPLTPTGAADGTLDVVGAFTSAVCAFAADASAQEIICDFPF